MASLNGWDASLEKLLSSTSQELLSLRIANFERAVDEGREGPGGAWTRAVVDALVEAARPDVVWPMRPPRGCLPPGLTCDPSVQQEPQDRQEWRWVEVPVKWLDAEGEGR